MNFQASRRRGEDGIAMVIDFLLSNARLVLGVGGAAMLGIATLAVKRVSVFEVVSSTSVGRARSTQQCFWILH